MGKIITEFSDGSFLEYDEGKFDDWCVYLTRPNKTRYAPRDYQYFDRLQEYACQFGADTLYADFIKVYDWTTKTLDDRVFEKIKDLTQTYGDKSVDIAIDFSIMYMGMVAEENKKFTKLGKRIKRLGVHQSLIEGMSYSEAANFSRGMKWREIDALCKSKGF